MPSGATNSTPDLARRLQSVLRRHNGRVAGWALLTLVGAVLLWYLLYAVSYWLGLLFVSSVSGLEGRMPDRFTDAFWFIAAGLLVLALIDRWRHPDARPRDRKSGAEIVAEIVLAIPRVTLAVWDTLSAWLALDQTESALAAALVHRLVEERRVRLQSLPLDLPDEIQREKIVFALQLLQIIDVRREDREYWVTLNPLRPRSLGLSPGDEAPVPEIEG